MRKYENGMGNGCGGSSRSCCGGEMGLYLPAELLEDAGFSSVTGLDDVVCTIEDGRILLELPDEEDEADLWDTLRDELPDELCARMEDAGLTAHEVWDILEKEGWFGC